MAEANNAPVPNAIHLLRTAVQTNMQLSQMADQKANMLIGASMVIFTLSVAQLRSGALVWSVAVLAAGVFLAATCAILAVLPSVGRPVGAVAESDNLLFFGIFTSLGEAEFSDRMMALVADDEALCRAMLRDMYQNGQILQRRKYRYLGYAYRIFLTGVVASFVALVVELASGPY
ncbi:Pycsar system effector family protein [Sphingobium sp.]|uniref:Pycsar system effector family protein n=1 Tax=Sphingobium sp. TaxID=1912891 RepID=UPI0028BE275D|nr:Pycsar system effector family protein [Sphingobium sp.]